MKRIDPDDRQANRRVCPHDGNGLPEDRPRSLLLIGYNTIDEAYAKGIICDDVPESLNVALNFGPYFEEVHLFVPFGRTSFERRLNDTIHYHERAFVHRRSPLRLLWAGVHLFRSARELRRLTVEIRPDVIQVCGPHIPNAVYMLSGLRGDYPTTLFLEAFWEDILPAQASIPGWLRTLLPWYYRLTYRFYQVIFGTPSLNREYYLRRGMTSDKISDWQQLVDIRLIDAAKRIPVSPRLADLSRPVVVTVGRLHEEKCSLDAVEVLKRIRDDGIDASLVLVGDGPLRAEVEAKVAGYGLQNHVCITGQLSIVDGLAAVWGGDVYFAPMQGSALLEALATGRPVVAYDHETHRALIRDSDTGLLVPHRDVDAAARKVIDLIRNPDRARWLGQNARRDCELKLDPVQMARRVNDGAYRAYKSWKQNR